MTTERKRMAQLRGTTADWALNDVRLLNGELGFEVTPSGVLRFKIGDGTRPWSQLPYFTLDADMVGLAANQLVGGLKVFSDLAIGTDLSLGNYITFPTDVGNDGETLMLDAANSRFVWGVPGSESRREVLIPTDNVGYIEFPLVGYVNIRVGTAEDPTVYFDIGMNTVIDLFTLYHRGADIIEPAPADIGLMDGMTGDPDSDGKIWVNLDQTRLQIQNRSGTPYTFVATSQVTTISLPSITADRVSYLDPANPTSVSTLKTVLDNLRLTGQIAPRITITDDHVGLFDVRSMAGDIVRITCERNVELFLEMVVNGVDNTYYIRDSTQGVIQESNPRGTNLQGTTGAALSDGRIWVSMFGGFVQLQNRIGRTTTWKMKG